MWSVLLPPPPQYVDCIREPQGELCWSWDNAPVRRGVFCSCHRHSPVTIFPRAAGELRVCSFGSRGFFLFVSTRAFQESSSLNTSHSRRERDSAKLRFSKLRHPSIRSLGVTYRARGDDHGKLLFNQFRDRVVFLRVRPRVEFRRSNVVFDRGSRQNFDNCRLCRLCRPPRAVWGPVPWSPGHGLSVETLSKPIGNFLRPQEKTYCIAVQPQPTVRTRRALSAEPFISRFAQG